MTLLTADRSSTELPLPVVRWLEVAWPTGIDHVESIAIGGRIRVRRGRVWLPGYTTMRFLLGAAYVSDLRLGIGPLTAIRGLDAFVDGSGITRVGGEASVGPEVDQAAFLALWSQSLLFPAAWELLPGLRWSMVDDTRATVDLPFRVGYETATLRFDPEQGAFPTAFEADRYKAVGRPRVGWRAEYDQWHRFDGLALPGRVSVSWADDPGPWLVLGVEHAVANERMPAHLDRARREISAARAAMVAAGEGARPR